MNSGSYESHTERETSSKSSPSKSQKTDPRAEVELPLWLNILIDTLKFIIEVSITHMHMLTHIYIQTQTYHTAPFNTSHIHHRERIYA